MIQPPNAPLRLAAALVGAAALPTAALAHTGAGAASGLAHGFAHPLGGADHVLAMLAAGVLAFVLGGRATWLVPAAFVAAMGLGFALGLGAVEVPMVEVGIALSSVVIGGAAALGRSMPVGAAMALVAAFAALHGHAHGAEMPAGAGGLAYAGGFGLSTALLHAAGLGAAALAALAFGRHGRAAGRLAGGVLALGGAGVALGWA